MGIGLLVIGSFHYEAPDWDIALLATRKPTKNGQQQVRLKVLRALMTQTKVCDVLEPLHPLPNGTMRNTTAVAGPMTARD